jgi:hypothetical protein
MASSTTKAGRHDMAEILLKVTLNTKNQIKSLADHDEIHLYSIVNIFLFLFQ